ncbi:hypothetical protein SAMN05216266_107243 [Amycolatopsis marina]|uniref:Uncharacterized protein n=1 Tax=Amycolatopsis marina TaxID=490629 RepID=A0A1I0ZVS4_9PSEU|nr:hypothetical protein [Amycolatopsis marina]SFB28520.1 hypothetical protein SAMN05216266_107243 [Amycolatopsis marina]
MEWIRRLLGGGVPEVLTEAMDREEHVVGHAATADGGYVAVTHLGLWVPDGGGVRRIGWHLISKAAWAAGTLTVTEAEESGRAGAAVLLTDRSPVRFELERPGTLPKLIRQRVDGSIRSRYHKELAGGGAWFVVRKVPGRDGVVLQVRADPGTDPEVVTAIAREAAAGMSDPRT